MPGFKSAESLRQSDIGLALRHAIADVAPASPIEEEADVSSADAAEYLSEQEFQNQLRLLQDDGVDQRRGSTRRWRTCTVAHGWPLRPTSGPSCGVVD